MTSFIRFQAEKEAWSENRSDAIWCRNSTARYYRSVIDCRWLYCRVRLRQTFPLQPMARTARLQCKTTRTRTSCWTFWSLGVKIRRHSCWIRICLCTSNLFLVSRWFSLLQLYCWESAGSILILELVKIGVHYNGIIKIYIDSDSSIWIFSF